MICNTLRVLWICTSEILWRIAFLTCSLASVIQVANNFLVVFPAFSGFIIHAGNEK